MEDAHFGMVTTIQLLINKTQSGAHDRSIVGCDNPTTGGKMHDMCNVGVVSTAFILVLHSKLYQYVDIMCNEA